MAKTLAPGSHPWERKSAPMRGWNTWPSRAVAYDDDGAAEAITVRHRSYYLPV